MGLVADVNINNILEAFEVARSRLEPELRVASLEAARAGVEAARETHPYTDRTTDLSNNSYAEQAGAGSLNDYDAEMVWPEDYASLVDRGTEHSNPYPFTPLAKKVAKATLKTEVAAAVARCVEGL